MGLSSLQRMPTVATTVVRRIARAEFAGEYWAPAPGEHATFIGPTGCGKTELALELMASAHEQHPDTRAVALVMKPDKGPKSRGRKSTGDETISRLTRKFGGRVTRQWPPRKWPWQDEPPLWAFWPRHEMDPDVDRPEHHSVFRRAILDTYATGDWWLFADEVYSLNAELKLGDELVTLWTKSRGMCTSVFAATQRPAHVPLWMYSEPSHFFLWKMRDGAGYDRLREIGGTLDTALITRTLARLKQFECVYLYPPGNAICVIEAR
jgi:energy-coupling factor transporter ATP-binding protein EcfA2